MSEWSERLRHLKLFLRILLRRQKSGAPKQASLSKLGLERSGCRQGFRLLPSWPETLNEFFYLKSELKQSLTGIIHNPKRKRRTKQFQFKNGFFEVAQLLWTGPIRLAP